MKTIWTRKAGIPASLPLPHRIRTEIPVLGGGMAGIFEGWYLKHENGEETFCVIPAFHVDKSGRKCASIQIVTEEGAWTLHYAAEQIYAAKGRFFCRIGNNVFSENGISLDIRTRELQVRGALRYGQLHPPGRDMMGPFRYVPCMQCRHGIVSMRHHVVGTMEVNGRRLSFRRGIGYIETDRGRSFPKQYFWTQCTARKKEGALSLMAAAADIPMGPFSFRGVIAEIWWNKERFRLASYCGARVVMQTGSRLVLAQNGYVLKVDVDNGADKRAVTLEAPQNGAMGRTITECVSGKVRYRMYVGGRKRFDVRCSHASVEAEGELSYSPGKSV